MGAGWVVLARVGKIGPACRGAAQSGATAGRGEARPACRPGRATCCSAPAAAQPSPRRSNIRASLHTCVGNGPTCVNPACRRPHPKRSRNSSSFWLLSAFKGVV